MKTAISSLALTILVVAGIPAMDARADDAKPGEGLVPNHEALQKRQQRGPVITGKNLRPIDHVPRARQSLPASLMDRSTVLANNGSWTIVPKHAVLTVPSSYRDRVDCKPSGTLLTWSQFFERNRGWVYTQAVRLSDARGETALSKAVLETHQSLGRVVVAVFQNGPISMPPQHADSLSTSTSNQ